jgi:precorrin-6Y C5,15-methyltransferase (decarboxylating)
VAAVTLETLSSALALARDLDLTGLDVISLSVAKAKRVANLHLMRAHNPVYLVSAFGPQAPGEA